MDFGFLGKIEFTPEFLAAFLSITLIDLVLAGDNAVVIALAVQNLHGKQRKWGIILGAGAAVLLRVIATFLCAQLLLIKFVKFVGGAVIIWIAVKLLLMGSKDEDAHGKAGSSVAQAIWIIVVADISMAIDNMLAVAGACKGNLFLLLFGLVLSIPLVVAGAGLLSMLMDRYPIILYIGAAILGKVGGEMMITDPFIENLLHPSRAVEYGVMIFFVLFVLGVAKLLIKRKRAKSAKDKEVLGAAAKAPAPAAD
ncbi:MAG: TerC family protein [Desulfobacterota bacterium]|jgi:YjbE family integral membrane protein|nr:TerC family protein [Thermodesulfobacteriota bacterium]